MAKASDLRGKSGVGGSGSSPTSHVVSINQPGDKSKSDQPSIAAERPDLGHNQHKPSKALGGAGGAGGRPKV